MVPLNSAIIPPITYLWPRSFFFTWVRPYLVWGVTSSEVGLIHHGIILNFGGMTHPSLRIRLLLIRDETMIQPILFVKPNMWVRFEDMTGWSIHCSMYFLKLPDVLKKVSVKKKKITSLLSGTAYNTRIFAFSHSKLIFTLYFFSLLDLAFIFPSDDALKSYTVTRVLTRPSFFTEKKNG